ncbi:MAG TPA: ATP-binding protein [Pyrinomonadaceae bacterium]|jgi:signal transduction histidine kinase/ActR/RegA family two-component response regulator|nr:ATP-binding protein [Pyrinomonadaceae bacterium]
MGKQRFVRPYMWAVIVAGACVILYAALNLPLAHLDVRLIPLILVTLLVSSRFCIPIPRTTGQVSFSDTFIFLTMLLYGGDVAVLLAAAELFAASRFGKKPFSLFTSLFNGAMMACSTFITVLVMHLLFGRVDALPHGDFSATFVAALCVMGLVQYVANSAIAAVHTSLKAGEPVWVTWRNKYLWTSITYFGGASAAGLAVKLASTAGFYALVAAVPIIAIVYLTYRTYLDNVEAMAAAAKAEAAAGARAESAAQQAEQARRHVEELSHYIAEQERIREQYAQIEKLSALGELASGVAHDFNNTLAGILGRAQLLLTTKDPEKVEAGLQLIIKTAKDGARTIKRIQDFARQRRDHDFQPVSVDQLLLDVREITRPRWKSRAESEGVHIALELQLGSDDARVMGDESELREVLINMVFNAVDAMPQGGTLTLSTRESGGAIEIAVSDNGEGMSEDVRSRVFDPFFTTKGKAGMGLGLAVSYGIIRRHEGAVEVESEQGTGTSFRIRLPAAKSAVMPAAEVTPPAALTLVPQPSGAARILVVDDEEHVRDLLRDILESEGYVVRLAGDGREALALLDGADFDAVFTDLGMKGMSGWEMAHAIRERDGAMPLAIITGWGDAVGSGERSDARVDWVVTKPFDAAQILAIAREVARRAEVRAKGAATAA